MANIVDTNTAPIRLHAGVDVLEFLRDEFVKTDGKSRWHELLKGQVAAALKPGLLLNPDLSGVRNVPERYWKARGGAIVEMDAAEKSAVDAALNPPNPSRDAVYAILSKADGDVSAAEVKQALLWALRKLRQHGQI